MTMAVEAPPDDLILLIEDTDEAVALTDTPVCEADSP
jgi:hypothetical protein